jgi:hypothetical protein
VFGPRLERGGRLLFPAFVESREQMLTDVRKLLDRLAVSIYTAARELGHQSDEMVKRIYAHLGATRHRSDVVEYRVEQHLEQLGDRLRRLGFGTGKDTGRGLGEGTETPASTEVSAGEDLPEWARRDSNARPLAPEASALSN